MELSGNLFDYIHSKINCLWIFQNIGNYQEDIILTWPAQLRSFPVNIKYAMWYYQMDSTKSNELDVPLSNFRVAVPIKNVKKQINEISNGAHL